MNIFVSLYVSIAFAASATGSSISVILSRLDDAVRKNNDASVSRELRELQSKLPLGRGVPEQAVFDTINRVADYYSSKNRPQQRIQLVTNLLTYPWLTPAHRAKLDLSLCLSHLRVGDIGKSESDARDAIVVLKSKKGTGSDLVEAYSCLSYAQIQKDDLVGTKETLVEMEKFVKTEMPSDLIASAYLHLSKVALARKQHDFKSISEYSQEALDILAKIPNPPATLRQAVFSSEGARYFNLGDFETASRYLKLAYDVVKTLPGWEIAQRDITVLLSQAYLSSGKTNLAQAVIENVPDSQSFIVLKQKGYIAIATGDFPKAKSLFTTALTQAMRFTVKAQAKLSGQFASVHAKLAMLNRIENNLPAATNEIQIASRFAAGDSNLNHKVEVLEEWAAILTEQSKFTQAEEKLKEAHDLLAPVSSGPSFHLSFIQILRACVAAANKNMAQANILLNDAKSRAFTQSLLNVQFLKIGEGTILSLGDKKEEGKKILSEGIIASTAIFGEKNGEQIAFTKFVHAVTAQH